MVCKLPARWAKCGTFFVEVTVNNVPANVLPLVCVHIFFVACQSIFIWAKGQAGPGHVASARTTCRMPSVGTHVTVTHSQQRCICQAAANYSAPLHQATAPPHAQQRGGKSGTILHLSTIMVHGGSLTTFVCTRVESTGRLGGTIDDTRPQWACHTFVIHGGGVTGGCSLLVKLFETTAL